MWIAYCAFQICLRHLEGALNNGDGGDQPVKLQSYHQLQDMSSYRAPLARINAEGNYDLM